MASKTAITEAVRRWKRTNVGKKRKRKEQNKGTTPKFPIHK